MFPFLGDLLSGGASKIIDAVGDAVGKFVTTDKEREALQNELTKIKQDALLESQKQVYEVQKAYLSDIGDARSMNARVEESQSASWLSKNIAPLIAVSCLGLCFMLLAILLFGDIWGVQMADKSLSNAICIGLFSAVTQILGFYFGSSQSSRSKDDFIKSVANNSNLGIKG